MSNKATIVCVGINAVAPRVCQDLRVSMGHRRVVLVSNDRDNDRLRGLRGANVLWLDYGVTKVQMDLIAAQELAPGTIEQARELLHGRP